MLQIEIKAGPVQVILVERGFPDIRAWIICHFGLDGAAKWEIIHARFQTEENPRSILPGKSNLLSGKPDLNLYIGANESLSK